MPEDRIIPGLELDVPEHEGFSTFSIPDRKTVFPKGEGLPAHIKERKGFFLSDGRLEKAARMLMEGWKGTDVAERLGLDRKVAYRLRDVLAYFSREVILCRCGKKVDHKGGCLQNRELCRHGHPMTGTNIILVKICKTCHRDHARRIRFKKKYPQVYQDALIREK